MICPWEKTPGKYRIPATPALQENYPAISDSCTTVSYRIKNNTFAATGAGTMRTVKKIFSPEPENRTDTAAKPGLRAYHAAAHFAVFSGCQVPVAVLCIAVLHICIMTGCSHEIPDFPGGTMTSVTFRLPDYPNETHPPLVGWHIETVSRGITRTQFIPAETDCITMDIPAGKAIPFLCYPITGTQDYPVRFFRPGIYSSYFSPPSNPAGFKYRPEPYQPHMRPFQLGKTYITYNKTANRSNRQQYILQSLAYRYRKTVSRNSVRKSYQPQSVSTKNGYHTNPDTDKRSRILPIYTGTSSVDSSKRWHRYADGC